MDRKKVDFYEVVKKIVIVTAAMIVLVTITVILANLLIWKIGMQPFAAYCLSFLLMVAIPTIRAFSK